MASIQQMLDAKVEQIDRWSRLAGGIGDEDGTMHRAIEAARAALQPMQRIASQDEAVQARILESLSSQGMTLDRLYDVRLFDDAAAASARVRARRERARSSTSWAAMWENRALINALGEQVDALSLISGKYVCLFLAAALSLSSISLRYCLHHSALFFSNSSFRFLSSSASFSSICMKTVRHFRRK